MPVIVSICLALVSATVAIAVAWGRSSKVLDSVDALAAKVDDYGKALHGTQLDVAGILAREEVTGSQALPGLPRRRPTKGG